MLTPQEVAQLTGDKIDSMLFQEYGARLKIDFPEHTAPIFDANGIQYRNENGNPMVLHHMHVEGFNALETMQMYTDPASTYSDQLAPHTLNLLATDTFLVTSDGYMALELRTKFGPASQVAPGTVLISSGGFAKHAPDGTAETAIDIAVRETKEELGIEINPEDLIKTHDNAGVEKRLPHYPELTLDRGYKIQGVRPSVCTQYLARLPMTSSELISRVNLNWESDGMVFVPLSAGEKLWSGARESINAILYPSMRIDSKTIVHDEDNLKEIFAFAERLTDDRGIKHPLFHRSIPFQLKRSDSVINGSENPCENLLRVARLAQTLG